MAVKSETKKHDPVLLDGMNKAKEENPGLFKKLEKM
jgi:hypothetical protein